MGKKGAGKGGKKNKSALYQGKGGEGEGAFQRFGPEKTEWAIAATPLFKLERGAGVKRNGRKVGWGRGWGKTKKKKLSS